MKKIQALLLPLILIVLSFSSCSSDKSQKASVYKNTDSAPWELLLVVDKEWTKTAEGEMLLKAINPDMQGLPQMESMFSIININSNSFSKSFQGFTNIVFVEFGSKYKKAEIRIAKDTYAHPQTIIYLTAPNGKELAEYASSRKELITNTLTESQLYSLQIDLAKSYSKIVKETAEKQFNLKINAPFDLSAIKKGKDFFWASSINSDNHLNLCLFTVPQRQIQDEYDVIHICDSVLKENIQGENKDQYPQTVRQDLSTKNIKIGDRIVTEIRGLWEMENDMMGGPFVLHFYNDSVNNRFVFADGFVYAPEKKKRNYIRLLEASLRTLK